MAQSPHSIKGKEKSNDANLLDCGGDETQELEQEVGGFALCALVDHRTELVERHIGHGSCEKCISGKL